MIIDINKKILNYLGYLTGEDEDSIVKQALQISIDLHHNGKTSFYSNLMKMVDYYDLNYDFSCNSLSDSIVNWYIGIMKNKYVSYWNQALQQSQKLSSTSTRLVCDTNMAAVSLSWDTNMAAVTSCENTLLWSVFK